VCRLVWTCILHL
uniref:Uncharacterized protein n=1 Tax=Amphimedon queenslandica TaxID=400682 RepID=A0A1X7VH35_AMPQE